MPPKKDTQQITFRLDSAELARASQAAVKLTAPGLVVTQTDALRRAIAIGLESILESDDPAREGAPRAARKAKKR